MELFKTSYSNSHGAIVIFTILTLIIISLFSENKIILPERYRKLKSEDCGNGLSIDSKYEAYINAMDNIHSKVDPNYNNCINEHKKCGYSNSNSNNNLPTFVLSIGLEGAGHHLWTEILQKPVFDCVWTNGRHYKRDIGSGVPRLTTEELSMGFQEQLKLSSRKCNTIYDSEDSFPTGAIRKDGRLFMRPDLINLQKLDGKLFNIKYLIIVRNTTDTVMSSLRRNFFIEIDTALRTVEHTLTYIEAALTPIPCNKIFIAHYEHVLADPMAYHEPLSSFLDLSTTAKDTLHKRLNDMLPRAKLPKQKIHELRQYRECGGSGGALKVNQKKGNLISSNDCYHKIEKKISTFFKDRSFMWPSFNGNGYNYKIK